MPELAEVEFYRKRWHQAAIGQRVVAVRVHPRARVFRGTSPAKLRAALTGRDLSASAAAAKQMLFRFGQEVWLGIHLGMSGELEVRPARAGAGKHDHLVLETARHSLVLSDPRMFGRVLLHQGSEPPGWWTSIAPAILSREFTAGTVAAFLRRRKAAPIKAVLLMQERFPGIGNWMADEILWRARLHPSRAAGSLTPAETVTLWRQCRRVCRLALDTIAGRGDELPRDLNVNIPDSWLFRHRWQAGGRCPRTGVLLQRTEIGGRTTCWSPARQPSPPARGKRQRAGAQRRTRR